MKTPMSEKTEEMKNTIEKLFPGTKQAILENKCPSCKRDIGEFKDSISVKEYEISGLCQNCQDKVFGV